MEFSCTFVSTNAASLYAFKNIKEYLLGQFELSQLHPIAVYCLRDCINSICFSIIHMSKLESIKISERILMKK